MRQNVPKKYVSTQPEIDVTAISKWNDLIRVTIQIHLPFVSRSWLPTPGNLERAQALGSDGAGFWLLFFWVSFGHLLTYSGINPLSIKRDYNLISQGCWEALKGMKYGDWFRVGILRVMKNIALAPALAQLQGISIWFSIGDGPRTPQVVTRKLVVFEDARRLCLRVVDQGSAVKAF